MSGLIVLLALFGFATLGVLLGWALDAGDYLRRTEQGRPGAIGALNVSGQGVQDDRSSSTKTRAGAGARVPYSAKIRVGEQSRYRRLMRALLEGPEDRE